MTRFELQVEDVPAHWYNILPQLEIEIPNLREARLRYPESTGQVGTRPQLPLSMYRASVSRDPFIEIPEVIRTEYQRWRPTTLFRASALENILDTPAHIYYKYEGSSLAGSHKLNTAIPQAYFYRQAGIDHLVTGTGAGQWGSALAIACQRYGVRCTVFMVRHSYDQKPYRSVLMTIHGADVCPSPSPDTKVGRSVLEGNPGTPGSLGIANAESIELSMMKKNGRSAIGSGENHVLMHQTILGEEALRQIEMAGDFPDIVIGSMGAGSNFAGLAFPFYRVAKEAGLNTRFLVVEPAACPKMTRGQYTWDYSDISGITPIVKMYTLGSTFVPRGIHAGGLRYHGAAPILSAMYANGLIEARSYNQREVFEAGVTFARTEGIVPAPESAHAVKAAIEEALRARHERRRWVILLNISGNGLLDLGGYGQYFSGEMVDYSPSNQDIEASLRDLPK